MGTKFDESKGKLNKSKGLKKPYRGRKRQENGDITTNSNNLTSLNDVSWYSRNPELLAAASRFPFPYKPGMTVVYPNVQSKDATLSFNESLTIPGVMAIRFNPTVGYSDDVNSPISIAAKELYGRVRSKFSGSLDADAPDMMMYNLALDSVHMYIAHLKRLYRAISTYSPFNRNYPDLIVQAITGIAGTDTHTVDELRRNKTRLWGAINELIHMVNKFVLPKDMDLYERHRWMCEHVYLDSPEPNSQSYIFVPLSVWEVKETLDTGTSLHRAQLPNTAASVYDVDALFNFGKDLIQKLSDWDDAYTISGYYSRAFDGDSLYVADLLLENERLMPVYQPEVLTQIENATAVGWNISIPDITQDPNTNALIFQPEVVSDALQGASRDFVYMNLHTNNPTGAEITIASRLMTFNQGVKLFCGTEMVVDFIVYITDASHYQYTNAISISELPTDASLVTLLASIGRLSWFHHHPVIPIYANTPQTPTEANTLWIPLGEIENFAIIPKASMLELHRVCVYSEFNCFR